MSNKRFRNINRIAHLIEGVFIALFVYSPLRANDTYLLIMQFVILPAIIISGVFMWQQPKIMTLLRRDTQSKSA